MFSCVLFPVALKRGEVIEQTVMGPEKMKIELIAAMKSSADSVRDNFFQYFLFRERM